MKVGEHQWDSKTELRTRCELSLRLSNGHQLFTAGKTPLATATLMPDGKTLDITLRTDRIAALTRKKPGVSGSRRKRLTCWICGKEHMDRDCDKFAGQQVGGKAGA